MGWRESKGLTKTTWGLIRSQRPLRALLGRGVVAAGVVGVVFAVPALVGLGIDNTPLTVLGVIVFLVGAWLATSIWMIHAGAMAHAADEALRGGVSPSAAEALAATRPRRRALAGWAAITVTVGLLLSALRGNGEGGALGIVRLLGAGILAAAWSVLTFFVVPVIVFEGCGPVDALKRSGHLLKERWGTQVSGNIRLGGLVSLLALLPAILFVLLGVALLSSGEGAGELAGGLLLLIGLAVFALGAVLIAGLRVVFGVAPYRYAESGQSVGAYSSAQLGGAVRLRGAH
jgi:hypothetical protein